MADSEPVTHHSVSKATQDIAVKVNENLPVKINGEDVEKTPQFAKLLKILSQDLDEDGISKPEKQDMKQVEKSLHNEKQFWLQHHILHTEVGELLLDNQLRLHSGEASNSSQQFYSAVHDCLMSAEISDFLEPNPDTQATLLGLSKADVQRRNPHIKHLAAIQQKLIPEVENRLRTKCETLVSFHESAVATDSSKLAFAKASQLPAVLEAERQDLEEHRKQLKRDRAGREKQFWQYYNALVSSLEVLQKVILKHRLQSQTESDNTNSEWITARCNAMCLKIKLLDLQLMCDTYNADTVQALKKIKHELNAATEKTKGDITAASQSLQAYESAGQGFEALVREYTYLRHEIENKHWAIRELKPIFDVDDSAT